MALPSIESTGERAAPGGRGSSKPIPPSAIFAANNLMMLGAVEAVIDMGLRCSDDISIAGIDDIPWSSASRPKLTTVAQPTDLRGCRALDMLFERVQLEGEGAVHLDPLMTMLEPEPLFRVSCARVAWPQRRRTSSPKLQGQRSRHE